MAGGSGVYVPLDGSLSAHMNIGQHAMHNDEDVQDEVRIRPYQPSAFRGEGVEEEEEEEERHNDEDKEGEGLDNEGGGSGSTRHTQQIKKHNKLRSASK